MAYRDATARLRVQTLQGVSHEAQGNTMQFHNKQGKYDDEVLDDNHDVSSICREACNSEAGDIGVHYDWVEMVSKRRLNRIL